VTSWVTEHTETTLSFDERKFTDFATVKEALIAQRVDAVFMLAPMAMQLRADGVPVKVVYLGHRDGTALVVDKHAAIEDFGDLRDKRIAIPNRFANQAILMRRMMRDWEMAPDSIQLLEVPPPEHPAALESGSIDGFIVGEPFAALAELNGTGRVLYQTKDIWPNFISCVLVVREEWIDEEPQAVQELVTGIARSGMWLESGLEQRMEAAEIAAENFYYQPKELLEYVLSKPPDRVKYSELGPRRDDFEEIMELALEFGILSRRIEFEEYVDDRFVPDADQAGWDLEHLPGTRHGAVL